MGDNKLIALGKITSVFGIKGWVKVYSYTEPMGQILDYPEWILQLNGRRSVVRLNAGKVHGKGLIAHIKNCDDRDEALKYQGAEIYVESEQLPELEDGEFYWHELEGLRVVTLSGTNLGVVDHMMSAGTANDVLVVRGNDSAIDHEERLIPYLMDEVVKNVDLTSGEILVDWQPDY
ncbi:ribosome maturation factor RimM [Gynuella sp.]|uniref:ribosome maturation factor RimM n=1 Tax=Gynuella sp. TaxID=2969146 RepID=UPI003D0BD4FC